MNVSINLEALRRDIKVAKEHLAKLEAVEEYTATHNHCNERSHSLAEIAEKSLTDLGRSAKVAEIVDFAILSGWFEGDNMRNMRNLKASVNVAMVRQTNVFYLVSRGRWDLVSRKTEESAIDASPLTN